MVRRRALGFSLAGLLLVGAGCSLFEESEPDTSGFCSVLVSAADPFGVPVDSLEPTIEDLTELRDAAPPEVQESIETMLEAFEAVAAEGDPDMAKEILAEQQEDLRVASDELSAYSLGICGIDLSR